MAEGNEEMLAVCGLDCNKCDIRRAQSDPEDRTTGGGLPMWLV